MSADESAPSGGEESASSGEESASSGEERGGPGSSSREPSEDELRAAYEAELSRLTTSDMIAQAIVSLLNIAARRLGPIGGRETGPQSQAAASPERDLEQVRDAIDAVRPMLEILERRVPEGVRPLRDALAQLQMAYAREVQSGAAAATGTAGGQSAPTPGAGEAAEPGKDGESQSPQSADEPGPAQKSGRLWVPGS